MEAKRLEELNAAASAEGADDETKARCVDCLASRREACGNRGVHVYISVLDRWRGAGRG